ncbi:MAG: hypothetical protein LAO76_09630 [Acidobacteriia bacterium]|nr:hypothetical protein [Terriglobia bacterium]
MNRSFLTLSLLLCAVLSGCGGHNSMPVPTPTPVISPPPGGFTTIKAISNSNPSLNFRLDGNINGNFPISSALSGVMHINNSPCFSFNTDIPLSGVVKDNTGDSDLLLALPSGQKLSFTLVRAGDFFGGTYSLTGAGCATPDQGTITTGSFNFLGIYVGFLNSSSGTSSRLTLTITTQTAPDVNGFFSATGSGTLVGISGTASCFTNATIDPSTTVLSGPNSQIVLLDSDPGKTGKTILTGTMDGEPFGDMAFNGTYTSTEGTCSNSGSISLLR